MPILSATNYSQMKQLRRRYNRLPWLLKTVFFPNAMQDYLLSATQFMNTRSEHNEPQANDNRWTHESAATRSFILSFQQARFGRIARFFFGRKIQRFQDQCNIFAQSLTVADIPQHNENLLFMLASGQTDPAAALRILHQKIPFNAAFLTRFQVKSLAVQNAFIAALDSLPAETTQAEGVADWLWNLNTAALGTISQCASEPLLAEKISQRATNYIHALTELDNSLLAYRSAVLNSTGPRSLVRSINAMQSDLYASPSPELLQSIGNCKAIRPADIQARQYILGWLLPETFNGAASSESRYVSNMTRSKWDDIFIALWDCPNPCQIQTIVRSAKERNAPALDASVVATMLRDPNPADFFGAGDLDLQEQFNWPDDIYMPGPDLVDSIPGPVRFDEADNPHCQPQAASNGEHSFKRKYPDIWQSHRHGMLKNKDLTRLAAFFDRLSVNDIAPNTVSSANAPTADYDVGIRVIQRNEHALQSLNQLAKRETLNKLVSYASVLLDEAGLDLWGALPTEALSQTNINHIIALCEQHMQPRDRNARANTWKAITDFCNPLIQARIPQSSNSSMDTAALFQDVNDVSTEIMSKLSLLRKSSTCHGLDKDKLLTGMIHSLTPRAQAKAGDITRTIYDCIQRISIKKEYFGAPQTLLPDELFIMSIWLVKDHNEKIQNSVFDTFKNELHKAQQRFLMVQNGTDDEVRSWLDTLKTCHLSERKSVISAILPQAVIQGRVLIPELLADIAPTELERWINLNARKALGIAAEKDNTDLLTVLCNYIPVTRIREILAENNPETFARAKPAAMAYLNELTTPKPVRTLPRTPSFASFFGPDAQNPDGTGPTSGKERTNSL